jgi:serine/threonine protein kinase
METNAAHDLLGKTLKTGWKVIERFHSSDNSTGAFFSVTYKVEKDNEICFLKAFDFAKFFQLAPSKGIVDIMGDMITAYKYEKDLSEHCRNHHVTKVAFVKEAGEETISDYTVSIVPYLIFDLADGDIRKVLDFSKKLDYAWILHSLHDVAVALKQLHSIDVSHQDLKPSNILVFNKKESKIGDLGRSICKDIDGPYNRLKFTGDFNYAPPEILYNYYEEDWNKRVFATDCYLLGSLVVFYFCGISMSALLLKHIPDNFRFNKWRGAFDEVRPYLLNGFANAIKEFSDNVDHPFFKSELTLIVEQLCFPLPEKRGHPKNIKSR